MKGSKGLTIILFIGFGILGVVLARYLLLDNIEKIAFKIFFEGKFKRFNFSDIFSSSTFLKCFLSFLVVGFSGTFLMNRFVISKKR